MVHELFGWIYFTLVGIVVTSGSIFLIYPLAEKLGLIDHPNLARKKHGTAVPVIGGLAIAVGLLIFQLVGKPIPVFLFLAILILVALGTLDDKYDVSAAIKLSVQIIAAGVIFFGTNARIASLGTMPGGLELMVGYFSLPITLVFIVGMINAINMVDGIDGLAAALCLMSFVFLISLAIILDVALDSYILATLSLLIGSLTAFLVFNLGLIKNRKIFLGDAGSMKLGLLLAFFLIEASQKPNSENALPASMLPWLVALPIMDAVSVMFFRWYKKRPIMAGDRTHLHHCFIDAGWSGRKTLLLILLISVLLSGVGLQLFQFGGLTSGIFFCIITAAYIVMKNNFLLRIRKQV